MISIYVWFSIHCYTDTLVYTDTNKFFGKKIQAVFGKKRKVWSNEGENRVKILREKGEKRRKLGEKENCRGGRGRKIGN